MSGAWHYDPVSMDDVWVEDPPVGTNYTDDLPDPNKFPGYTYDPKQGGYTLIDDTGERQTIDQDGNIIRVTDSTGKVVYGTDVTGSSGGIDVSGLAKTLGKTAFDQFKGLFTKKDADGNDVTDWAKVAAAGGALLGASGVLKKPPQLTGYQGGIPTYTAVQQQVPGTYDPTRRPGSSGQRYFTDVIQSAPADVASAKTAVGEQATGLAALNAANPAMQKRPVATVPTTPAPATVVADPASSVIKKLEPTAGGLASVVNAASGGGITALKGGNYLSGPTDGMADKLPANIEGNQEARLSHGEFVIPADVVSHLGNGNSDAGADRLYSMMDKIRKARTGTKKQGKQINPNKFLPGGLVGYAEGGIKGFAGETGSKVTVPANAIGAESNLSNWAGPYVTDMLGKGAALANTPYQSYSGPLTAGASAGQTAAFDASAGLNIPTSKMGAFTPQTFTADQAQNYMNPYLSAALNPQMEEMRRQSQLNLQPNMAKLTQAGGYGGSRQALLQSESNRNLQTQQNAELGKGYQTAFDKAMGQFNTEQGRGLDAQTANNAYGLQALSKQAELGGQQRAIEQEGIAADKAQFEEERNDPFTKLTFQQKLLQGLPIQAQSNNYQQSNWLDDAFTAAGGANKFFEKIFATTPASTTTTVKT